MSNTWIIYLRVWGNPGKPGLIPDVTTMPEGVGVKGGRRLLPPGDEFTSHQVVGEVTAHQAEDG